MKFRLPFVSLILSPILALQPLLASTTIPASAVPGDVSQTPPLQVSADVADGAIPPGGHSNKGFVIHISDQAGAPVADAAVLLRLPETGATGTFSDATHATVGYTDAAGNVQVSGIQWGPEAGVVPVIVTATKGAAHAGVILEQHLDSNAVAASAPAAIKPAVAAPDPPKAILTTGMQPGPITAYVPTLESQRPPVIAPSVSVVNAPTHQHFDSGSSHKKWIILAVLAAAAAGGGFALMGKKSSSSSSTPVGTTTTIGAPTITVGAP